MVFHRPRSCHNEGIYLRLKLVTLPHCPSDPSLPQKSGVWPTEIQYAIKVYVLLRIENADIDNGNHDEHFDSFCTKA